MFSFSSLSSYGIDAILNPPFPKGFLDEMDCLESENVCSVKKEDNLDFYRIHTVWMKDRFRINIASKNGAWTGEMTPENIKCFSNNLQIDQEKYLTECKEALTTDDGKNGYSYIVENGSFNWKKMIDEDSGMKVKMGSVMLQPVSFTETLQNIIEVSLRYKKNLSQQVESLLKDKEADSQRINDFKMILEELIDKKNVIEGDLYSKFLLLLNTKKQKIQELQESLNNVRDETKFTKEEESQKPELLSNPHPLHPFEMDTEDDDDDDDDEGLGIRSVKCPVKKPYKKKGINFKNKISGTDLNGESEKSTMNTLGNGNIDECDNIPEKALEESIAERTFGTSQNVNNDKKLFPATRDGILDFFFG